MRGSFAGLVPPKWLSGLAAFLLWLCLFTSPTLAFPAHAETVSERLASGIASARIKSVFVVDFLAHDGKPSTLGWYLADELSEDWLSHKPKFRVVDRSELTDSKVTPEELSSPEMVKRLGSIWGASALVTGTVEESADQYLLIAKVIRVADSSTVFATTVSIPHSRLLDLVSQNGLGGNDQSPSRAGVNGTGIPQCVYCPNPEYTMRARKVQAHGTVLLMMVISADGQADKIDVVKGFGYGLTEKAIAAVSQWRLKPAIKNGKAVAAVVPIEVTFRLY